MGYPAFPAPQQVAVQVASSAIFGIAKVDGTTITASGGVLSGTAGGGVGTAGGSNTQIQFNNAGPLGGMVNATTDGNNPFLTAIVAPATPAAGKGVLYVDSTNKVLALKNDAGTVSSTVVPSAGAAHQFATAVSAAGVFTWTQPAFTDISGLLPSSQINWPLLAPDGTIGAPSYSWANETNTGWYRGGSHLMKATVNGIDTVAISQTATGVLQIVGVFYTGDGTISAPGLSWGSETTSGFYRAATKDMRATVNSADVNRWTDHNFDMGYKVVAGDGTTFYYPTGISAANSFGLIARFNRIFVGTEALEGAQLNQSPLSWVAAAYGNVNTNAFGSLNVTNQIGGYPIVASTRTSDFRTAFASASGGSGVYILALNDDTGAGGPIASALNATAVRNSSSITGSSQALQCDVENRGNTVDDTPWTLGTGDTRGITLTNGAFFNPVNPASAGIYFGSGNGAGPGTWRKCIVVANNAVDLNVGIFGGGTFAELPRGCGIRWINSSGGVDNEFGETVNGCGPINALKAGSLGIWPGIGDGGAVTQATSIATSVTINKICGQITTVSNAWTGGFAGSQAFVVNNSLVAATDVIPVSVAGTTSGNYLCTTSQVLAGSFQINITPYLTATEAITINFFVLKSVNN